MVDFGIDLQDNTWIRADTVDFGIDLQQIMSVQFS